MEDKRFCIIIGFAALLTLSLIANIWLVVDRLRAGSGEICRVDTIRYMVTKVTADTIHDSLPKIVHEQTIKYVSIPHDSIDKWRTDTIVKDAEVVIPITQARCTDDSTYTAWVSGYRPCLDSIEVYRRNTTTMIQETVTKTRHRHWNLGLQAGAGLDVIQRKPVVYLGVGIGWSP